MEIKVMWDTDTTVTEIFFSYFKYVKTCNVYYNYVFQRLYYTGQGEWLITYIFNNIISFLWITLINTLLWHPQF